MQGMLELNLDPAYMSFVSERQLRRFKYCHIDEIRNLLVDLGILDTFQSLPQECIVHLKGSFPVDVLQKYGLVLLGTNLAIKQENRVSA